MTEQVVVTAYTKGQCWLHKGGGEEDCACALNCAFQDVVSPARVAGLVQEMEQRGLIVKTREPARAM